MIDDSMTGQTLTVDTKKDYGIVVVGPPTPGARAPEGTTMLDVRAALSPLASGDPTLRRNVALALVAVANGIEPGLHAHSHSDTSEDLKAAKEVLTPFNMFVGLISGVVFGLIGLTSVAVIFGPAALLFALIAVAGFIFIHWSLGTYTALSIALRAHRRRKRGGGSPAADTEDGHE